MGPSTAAAAPVAPALIVELPFARLTAPSSGANLSAGETAGSAAWSATALALGNRSIVKVELLVNGVVVTGDTSAPYGGRFSTRGLPPQTRLQARAIDSSGGRSATPFENATRIVVVSSPVLDSGVLGRLPPVRVASTTRLVARPLPVPGVDLVRVEYRVDGNLVGTATAPPWDVAWTAPAAPADDLVIEARSIDRAGADATATQAIVDVIDDGAAVSITAPAGGAVVTEDIEVIVSASPAIAPDDTVRLLVDGVPAGAVTGATTVPWDSRSVDDGPHLLHVLVDRAGGGTDVIGTGTAVTVSNTTEPSLSFTLTPPGPAIRGNFVVQAMPANVSDDPIVAVRYEIGSSIVVRLPSHPSPFTWQQPWFALPDGNYRARVIAELQSGRILRAPDKQIATINIRAWMLLPRAGATIAGTVLLQAAGVCDRECGIHTTTFRLDGAVLAVTDTSSPGRFTWDSTTVANGPHTIAVSFITSDGRRMTTAVTPFTVSN
jgi:hypothetical protein